MLLVAMGIGLYFAYTKYIAPSNTATGNGAEKALLKHLTQFLRNLERPNAQQWKEDIQSKADNHNRTFKQQAYNDAIWLIQNKGTEVDGTLKDGTFISEEVLNKYKTA